MEASFVGGVEADDVDKSRRASAANVISSRSSRTLSPLLAVQIVRTPLMQLGAAFCHLRIYLGRNQRYLEHLMVYH